MRISFVHDVPTGNNPKELRFRANEVRDFPEAEARKFINDGHAIPESSRPSQARAICGTIPGPDEPPAIPVPLPEGWGAAPAKPSKGK